jgi:hypothetical protein
VRCRGALTSHRISGLESLAVFKGFKCRVSPIQTHYCIELWSTASNNDYSTPTPELTEHAGLSNVTTPIRRQRPRRRCYWSTVHKMEERGKERFHSEGNLGSLRWQQPDAYARVRPKLLLADAEEGKLTAGVTGAEKGMDEDGP